ncbi:Uncharacterised protein [Pseudomonas aeruginosa]|nr:Uncharacterised protein [Pseudomonas aeruginosa]
MARWISRSVFFAVVSRVERQDPGSRSRRPSSRRAFSAASGVRSSWAASAMNCDWRSKQTAQALGEVVQRLHQRAQLTLHLEHRQRAQVVRLALLHLAAQAVQRAQRGAHRQPHQHQRADPEQAQAQQGIGHQAACHALAGALGLGHADLRHAAHARLADWLQQAHHAHVDALVDAVVELRQGRIVVGAQSLGGRRRKILIAGDHAPVDVVDLVEDPPGAVVGEGVQGHVGHVGAQRAVLFVEAVGDRSRRGQQGPVVGGVGRLAAVPVGAQAARQQH